MITDSSIEIDAPAETVWRVFVDVERWAEWTASIERIVALDGPGIEVGKRKGGEPPGEPTDQARRLVAAQPHGSGTRRAIYPHERFEIKQPRFPKLVWEVTEVDPGVSWTWRQRSIGGTTLATHEVVPQDGGTTLVRQRIDQRGPVGVVFGRLTRGLTNRYLRMEGEGLKARSEERKRQDSSPA